MTIRLAAILVTTVVVAGVAPAAQAADQKNPFVKPTAHSVSHKIVTTDARPDVYTVREDQRLVVGLGKGLLSNDRGATRAGDLRQLSGTGKGKIKPNGAFTFVPKPASHGLEVFSYGVTGAQGTDRASVRVRVLYVNDAPSFVMQSLPTGLSATEDTAAPAVKIVKSTAPAPAGQRELGQRVRVKVTTSNRAMFAVQPVIDKQGNLTYTLAKDASGTATLVLTPKDSGGTKNGGRDAGKSRALVLTVAGVNDAPVLERVEATLPAVVDTPVSLTAVATDVDPGDVLSYSFDCDGDGVFEVGPQAAATITCTFATVGNRTVTAKVTDKAGASSTKQLVVAVQAKGDVAPTAVVDAATVVEDSSATAIDVLANDTDADGGPKSVTAATQPAHGTVVVAADGSGLTYQPSADYNGADSFTYTVNGGSTATVSMTVDAVDDAPVAKDDAVTVDEDADATAINVLANDTDTDGGPKNVASVGDADHGTVELTDGVVTYKPVADFNGADSFTYTLNGGSTATVNVTVDAVDDKAVANDDALTVDEDADATEVDVLANDTDVEGDDIEVTDVSNADHGTVELDEGVVSYTPNADYNGADEFTYALNGRSTATVTVTVDPVDDKAVANDDTLTVDEDADATEVDVLANDTDVEGDTVEVTGVEGAAHGTVELTDGVVIYKPEANYNGTDSFTYTVTDGDTATVTIDVAPVDDQAVANDDALNVDEDADATEVDVLANDTDVEGDTIEVTDVSNAAHGTVDLTDGVVTYKPNANYNGTDEFTYELNGGSTATVSVTVTPVDDAPVAIADAATVAEDSNATAIDVLANDTDIDGGPKSIASVTQPANGAVVITGGGTGLTYKPGANFNGTVSFSYTLNGGATAFVTITVTAVDDAPVAVNDAYTVVEDSNATALNVLANDTDIDGGPKSIASVTQPANGTVTITGGGTGMTYKPAANFFTPLNTPDTFTYTLNGGSTATVSMTVSPVADAGTANNPTIAAGAGTTPYVLGAIPVVVAPNLVTTHPDWPSFSGATITVTNPAEGDVLAFTPQSGITGTFANYTLTLSGTASPAAYQAALRSVTFYTPTTGGSPIIRFAVKQGAREASSDKTIQIS